MRNFEFTQQVVMRSPVLPLDTAITEASIIEFLKNPTFLEALYLASTSLYYKSVKLLKGELTDPKEEERVMVSVATYLNRMCSRCTPFGLFASCAVGQWGREEALYLNSQKFTRHTRLDMSFLCELADQLSVHPSFFEHLHFYANSTLYNIGDEIRYVENVRVDGRQHHQISSIASSNAIRMVLELSDGGATVKELESALSPTGTDQDLVRKFIFDLIASQVIVSEFEPQVTGQEFSFKIKNIVNRIAKDSPSKETEQVASILDQALRLTSQLDQQTYNSIDKYQAIQNLLGTLDLSIDKKNLFQTDLARDTIHGTLNEQLQHTVTDAVTALEKLTSIQSLSLLSEFKSQFYNRYESQELPLNVVLDTEIGIGYSDMGKDGNNPLIEDLFLVDTLNYKKHITQNEVDRFLFEKIKTAEISAQSNINLTKTELELLPQRKLPLPPSMAAVFRVTNSHQLYLENMTGPSAKNLLARFAHGDPQINGLIQSITQKEEEQNPDIIFAEIVHLPEPRAGNILLRPVLHAYEIPYLAATAVGPDFEISIEDLYVSVQNNQVILRSKLLNKVIIPRLSSAHNYTHRSKPIYRFLCDLQNQGCQTNLSIDWNPNRFDCQYLPRLTYKKAILGLETWEFGSQDIEELIEKGLPAFDAFKERWDLPNSFILVEGDRELVVDSNYPLTVKSFLKSIRKAKSITVKEYLFSEGNTVVKDETQHSYANQFIAVLTKDQLTYSNVGHAVAEKRTVTREFPPGTEWIYFKIYCGIKSADKILTEVIKPLTEELILEKSIDHWFFIRYADPDYHLRIRLHVPEPTANTLGLLMDRFNQKLSYYKKNHHYWKLQIDTYRRELERYGESNILNSELLFYYDTINILHLIQQIRASSENGDRWLWGLVMAENLLDAFEVDQDQRFNIIAELNESFCREFKVDRPLKHQLDKKYRKHRDNIRNILDSNMRQERHLNGLIANKMLHRLSLEIKKQHENRQLPPTINEIIKSYIHMSVNRLMPAKQRTYELMIYNFLFREYKSRQALLKY